MKTITYITYSIEELKEQFPDAYARAVGDWENRGASEHGIPWQDEIIDSLKKCVSMAGLELRDYSLGAYNRGNHISVRFPEDSEAQSLTGKRAFAWLENNLFGKLRISYTARNRWELSKYNRSYAPGSAYYSAGRIKPCPLTGYCADEDYLSALKERVRKGDTLKEAFESLAEVCEKLLENECEDIATERYFVEHAEANEWEFTEEGELN